jgi:pimeloyl-ACP methyl ester carboxylesterase
MQDYPTPGELGREAFPLKNAHLARYGGSLHGRRDAAFFYGSFGGPEYSWFDLPRYLMGMGESLLWMWEPLLAGDDPTETRRDIAVPVYLVSGRHDRECPYELAREYYEVLKAPSKRFVTFEDSAHSPQFEEAARFNRFMVDTVLAENRGAAE